MKMFTLLSAQMRGLMPKWVLMLGVGTALIRASSAAPAPLEFKPNERVVFIGNTFAERLTWHGYFEAMLAGRFAEHNLTFRNLAFSGDEAVRGTLGTVPGPGSIGALEHNVFLQLRALNFGDIFSHLEQQRADVIFACYGMNESLAGPEGLPKFQKDLTLFLTKLMDLKCGTNRNSPRVILVSPIVHEDIGGDLPNPEPHNKNLALYTKAMSEVAQQMNLRFIDLFKGTQQLVNEAKGQKLTINGIHLNNYGNWAVSLLMLEQLGLLQPAPVIELEPGSVVTVDPLANLGLRIPAPPGKTILQPSIVARLPKVKSKGFTTGLYKLRVDGKDVSEGGSSELKRGQFMFPLGEAAGALVAAVDDKNWEFFMKYRAVNGEYIYGRRKSPFGVVNFPGEFDLQEKLVAERDARIHALARSAKPFKLELIKVD